MAKGLNINAIPFEPGVSNTPQFSGYLPGPFLTMTMNPSIYFGPAHPHDAAIYPYVGPDSQPLPTVPMFYYGPNYSAMPQAPCQWPAMPLPVPQPPPPPQLPPPAPPQQSQPPPLSRGAQAKYHSGIRSHRGGRSSSAVLKVLTTSSSTAANSDSQKSKPCNSQSTSSSKSILTTTTTAVQVQSQLPGTVAKGKTTATAAIQLESSEDFPALGSVSESSSERKIGKLQVDRQAAIGNEKVTEISHNAAATLQSKPSLPFSYSAAIKQPRPQPVSLAPHQIPPAHKDAEAKPAKVPAESANSVSKVSSKVDSSKETLSAAEANLLQQKQKKKKSRSRGKRKKKNSSKEKQQEASASADQESTAQQQPAFQLEQEDFPTLGGPSEQQQKSQSKPAPPPQQVSTGSQPQSVTSQASASASTVARKQPLNRAARQSLLLSSSLLVVNKAIVVGNQRAAATVHSAGVAKATNAGGSGGVGHSSAAPMRVGKQREKPKAKKKSLTKKIILMERQARRKMAAEAKSEAQVDATDNDKDKQTAVVDEAPSNEKEAEDTQPEVTSSPAPEPAKELSTKQAQPPSKSIHSRRFREYCDQLIGKSVQELSVKVLRDLAFFQARARARDPAKAKQKRRLVMGLREARKHIGLNRIRLVFISPDMEQVQAPGGLDDSVNQLIGLCQQRNVPYVFGLKRREMGRVLKKTVPVSVVAVFDYQGCEANVNALLELVRKAKADYQTLSQMALECAQPDTAEVANDASVANQDEEESATPEAAELQQPSSRPAAGHSRNSSDTSNPVSEPLSELDASAPSATAQAAATGASSQLYGFHSRQSSLGVVVIAQAIEEVDGQAAPDGCDKGEDKVAQWLSADS